MEEDPKNTSDDEIKAIGDLMEDMDDETDLVTEGETGVHEVGNTTFLKKIIDKKDAQDNDASSESDQA